mmetsp:Transcript_20917/g.23658  ORF Transcript_20917/g.23658 Transcript_20917/m.23658 type:complete len:211 (+) Transcript_20917:48-680(+)
MDHIVSIRGNMTVWRAREFALEDSHYEEKLLMLRLLENGEYELRWIDYYQKSIMVFDDGTNGKELTGQQGGNLEGEKETAGDVKESENSNKEEGKSSQESDGKNPDGDNVNINACVMGTFDYQDRDRSLLFNIEHHYQNNETKVTNDKIMDQKTFKGELAMRENADLAHITLEPPFLVDEKFKVLRLAKYEKIASSENANQLLKLVNRKR